MKTALPAQSRQREKWGAESGVQRCTEVFLKQSLHTLTEPNQMGIFQDHTLLLRYSLGKQRGNLTSCLDSKFGIYSFD